ncbi:S-adenosyl-L-methionine-dependent methyltransferase [Phanerochaete sordida]|uniref:S-adenosyl-L-methionine-dependent methyltransferase n=1 Tax=Phanerochaete sordida TaxID=48140 RepID=A0A9P3LLG2_9APHY|nr:S-adenosyl-L-methionine-dependent methyltransferase [Phanerochaete sordida]
MAVTMYRHNDSNNHLQHNMDNSGSDPNESDDGSVASFDSDASSDVTELDQSDFAGYFHERDGRLFHSHGQSPYPLPVDAREQARINGQHGLLGRLLGSNYLGPVGDVVRTRRRVLDLCTGTGRWVLDMAEEFPNVRFDGIDIVPISTRAPPRNVFIEMADINEPWRWQPHTFDFVHARSVSMAVRDYAGMLDQAARVLRPGGLFLACEWGRFVALHDGRDVAGAAPRTAAFFRAVREALEARGVPPVAEHLEQHVRDSGRFDHIVVRRYTLPIGDWDAAQVELGRDMRAFLVMFVESLKPLLVAFGTHAVEVDDFIRAVKLELETVRGMVAYYYTVHGRRVE